MRRSQSMYVPSISQPQPQLQQESTQITEDIVIWRGGLQWTAKQNGQVFHRNSFGEVSYRIFKGGTRVSGEGWPSTLQMQMIPKSVLNLLGQEGYFIGSKTVIVGLQECEAVASLKVYMQAGHLGCVHIDSEMKNLFCPIKVFIMHYTGKGYIGVIPNDQVGFINRLRLIIQQKRNDALQKMVLQQQQINSGQQQQQPQNNIGQQQPNNVIHQQPLPNNTIQQQPNIIIQQQPNIVLQQHNNVVQQHPNNIVQQRPNNMIQLQQYRNIQPQQNMGQQSKGSIMELNQQQSQQNNIIIIRELNKPPLQYNHQFHQNNIQQQRQNMIEEIAIESDGETESATASPAPIYSNVPDSPDSLPPESNQRINNISPEVSNAHEETNIVTCPVSERKTVWNGSLQWLEKQPGSLRVESILRHVSCSVTSQIINGQPKVDGKLWPPRLVMQLIPKEILINICENGYHEMKTVGFELVDCDAVKSLTLLMKSGFAGCVHFAPDPKRSIKLLILLYSKELQRFLGFVPIDQVGLVTKIREVIVKMKEEISSKQAQQYKKIQAETAASNQLAKKTGNKAVEVITLDESSEISENQIAGAAEKALEQLSRKPSKSDRGSVHHCTAFRII